MDALRNVFQNTTTEEELKLLNRTLLNLIRDGKHEDFLDVTPLVVKIIKEFTSEEIELLVSGRISFGCFNNDKVIYETCGPRHIGPGTKYKYDLLMLAKQVSLNPGVFSCVFGACGSSLPAEINKLTYQNIKQLSAEKKKRLKLRKGASIVRWKDLSVAIKKPGITNQELMLCLQ